MKHPKTVLALILCLALFTAPALAAAYGPGGANARIRLYNARVMTASFEVIWGEVWTDGREISYVGAPADAQAQAFDLEIDLNGSLIMPGLKNGHAHSPMTFLRSYADDLPLDAWLNEKVYPMEAQLTAEDVYLFYTLAVMEYLESGITAAFDMYVFTEAMARAAVDTGFRAVFCLPLSDYIGSVEAQEAEYLALNGLNDRVSAHLGFHAEYTTSEDTLRQLAALSEKYKAPVYFHSSETAAEVEGCLARHGMTPTEYFDSLGLLAYGGGAYHCVHVTQSDLTLMKARGIGIVTNPGSNSKLASGIAPVPDMLASGIVVGLGTDGASSNNALDMFREMYLASALGRLASGDPTVLPASQVLHMATAGSAQIMGLKSATHLEAGMLADLIALDLDRPNMHPINDLANNIVYAGGKQNVCVTMVDGRILYKDGEFYIGVDPDAVYREAEERLARIVRAQAASAAP